MLVVGIVIGSGIFLTSGIIARAIPHPGLIIAAWALGGVVSLAGALTFAELGAAFPGSGGLYVYLREAYGPLPAFLYGWLNFVAYQTGVIAALAVGFAEYLGHFAPGLGIDHVVLGSGEEGSWSVSAGQLMAALAILVLTAVNVRGLTLGKRVQNVVTALKVLALLVFVVLGLLADPARAAAPAAPAGGLPTGWLAGLGVALVAVLWTYDGWLNVPNVAEEMRDPRRALPRALVGGLAIVTVAYVLTNVAYLRALPLAELQGEVRVAERAAAVLLGAGASTLISGAVLLSTLGAANGVILTAARIYYAMGRDGLFFRRTGVAHPRFRTPHVALWAQGLWAAVLALSGRYDQLIIYATFASLLIYVAGVAALFRLRRIQPDVPRPYRVPFYPALPLVFLIAVLLLLASTILERPTEAIVGLSLLGLGVPAFAYWRNPARRRVSG
jgi:APA family basic amino acid/polyamine antiporter